MHRRRLLAGTVAATCTAACCWSLPTLAAAPPMNIIDAAGRYRLGYAGSIRDTLRQGRLDSRITLKDLSGVKHLYAVGPGERLRAEVTVWDSEPMIARIDAGAIRVERTFDVGAPFLVWASVARWRDIELPAAEDMPALEVAIARAITAAGFDPDQPLPFLLAARARTLDYHLLNKTDDTPHSPAEHDRIKVRFSSPGVDAQAVGFFSRRHEGVFTHHGERVHMHLRTPAAEGPAQRPPRLAGHIDQLGVERGARLSLPA